MSELREAIDLARGRSYSERRPGVSVVVPCYNEEEVIGETHRRLTAACQAAAGQDYEIVYINDGSRDSTWSLLSAIARADEHVVAICLARNFGHQIALTAGLNHCRGGRILMIDADLQDPPELLSEMMSVMDGGADVVYGLRTERQGESAFKKATASAFYRLLSRLTDVAIPQDVGDFRLMTRKALDALLSLPEQHRFVRGMVSWLGFRQIAFPYVRHERFAGETKYPIKKMLRLAIDAITGFSIVPLRMSIWFSVAAFVVAVGSIVYALVSWLFFSVSPGWTSLLIVLSFFASAQFFCLGVFGEYLGRTYQEAKRRPLYLIDEVVRKTGSTMEEK